MTKVAWLGLCAAFLGAVQEPRGGVVAPATGDRIAWYATWEQGRAEAARTGRPIFFLSAAPHCHEISGLW